MASQYNSSSGSTPESLQTELLRKILSFDNNAEDSDRSPNIVIGIQGILASLKVLAATSECFEIEDAEGSNSENVKKLLQRFETEVHNPLPYEAFNMKQSITAGGKLTKIANEVALMYSEKCMGSNLELCGEKLGDLENNIILGEKKNYKSINDAGKKRTVNFMNEIVTGEENAKVVLVSQTALLGNWSGFMIYKKTADFNTSPTTTKRVDYHRVTSWEGVKVLKRTDLGFEAVTLPLPGYKDSKTSPIVVMVKLTNNSNTNTTTETVFADILKSVGSLSQLAAQIDNEGSTEKYDIITPLFKYENNLDVGSVLLSSHDNDYSGWMQMLSYPFKLFANKSPVRSVYLNIHSKSEMDFNERGIATKSKCMVLATDGYVPRSTHPKIVFDEPFIVFTLDKRVEDGEAQLLDVAVVTSPPTSTITE